MVLYLELDPQLPDLGWERFLPRPLTADAVRAIHECTDVGALGAMAGAARSYWAAAGGMALFLAFGAVFLVLGYTGAAVGSLIAFVPAVLVTIEARRRALQWHSVIAARLVMLGAVRP